MVVGGVAAVTRGWEGKVAEWLGALLQTSPPREEEQDDPDAHVAVCKHTSLQSRQVAKPHKGSSKDACEECVVLCGCGCGCRSR